MELLVESITYMPLTQIFLVNIYRPSLIKSEYWVSKIRVPRIRKEHSGSVWS